MLDSRRCSNPEFCRIDHYVYRDSALAADLKETSMVDSIDRRQKRLAYSRYSEPSVRRLSLYYRAFLNAENEGSEYLSSAQIGSWVGVSHDQVRQDFKSFAITGKQGKGYPVKSSIIRCREILGHSRDWLMILVGIGNLGRALLEYPGFWQHGYQIVAGFDIDPRKVTESENDVCIYNMNELNSFVESNSVDIGIIAVPGNSAQDVCDQMIDAGIKAILNFAPERIELPKECFLRNVDITFALETLSFLLTNVAEQ